MDAAPFCGKYGCSFESQAGLQAISFALFTFHSGFSLSSPLTAHLCSPAFFFSFYVPVLLFIRLGVCWLGVCRVVVWAWWPGLGEPEPGANPGIRRRDPVLMSRSRVFLPDL